MKVKIPKIYLLLVFIATVISGLVQFFAPYLLSSNNIWSLAPGWQREIAFWNLGLITIICLTLNRKDSAYPLIIGIVVLTLTLGINHLLSYLLDAAPVWHLYLGILNLLGMVGGLGILHINKSNNE